jgi:FtsZ-binding cell division protein ZapB
MSGFFKKAMGLFVEFEEAPGGSFPKNDAPSLTARSKLPPVLNAEDLDKFEKHFEKLFDQANLPGPDYYEFMRMNETLESHIKDDKARLAATFASLTIQGLTKDILIQTAARYKEIVHDDKNKFEQIARQKHEDDIGGRRRELQSLEEKIRQNAEVIQKLTQEITEAKAAAGTLKGSISQEEERLEKNKQGYLIACEAMIRKIDNDLTKIQNDL